MNSKIRTEDSNKAYRKWEDVEKQGIKVIYPSFPDFPVHSLKTYLLEIAPPVFIKGQRELLTADGVAIVGARAVSDTGIQIARKFAAVFARAKLNVVSGYANGVDSEAHLGALHAEGTTTMVLSCGIRKLYQKKAFKAFDWQDKVLVVSQFDPDAKWSARNAMARNKLVCALSKAIVVIESGPERDSQGKMSGTFNTAQTTMRMGLPLFVIDPRCFDNPPQGNVDLIKLGGKCLDPVSGAEEVVKYIEPAPVKKQEVSGQLTFLDVFDSLGTPPNASLVDKLQKMGNLRKEIPMLRSCTRPDWNGWIYYYNEEIRKLSYDEYNYEIDLTVKSAFLVGDHLQRVINKDWTTEKVFDGLVNAFYALFDRPDVRKDVCEKAAMLRHHRWGNTEVNKTQNIR